VTMMVCRPSDMGFRSNRQLLRTTPCRIWWRLARSRDTCGCILLPRTCGHENCTYDCSTATTPRNVKYHPKIVFAICYYYYYYVRVMFANSYSENSHGRANAKNMLSCIVQSSAGDEMTWQRVPRCGVVLVARSTLTVQRLQSCMDRNGLSS